MYLPYSLVAILLKFLLHGQTLFNVMILSYRRDLLHSTLKLLSPTKFPLLVLFDSKALFA